MGIFNRELINVIDILFHLISSIGTFIKDGEINLVESTRQLVSGEKWS